MYLMQFMALSNNESTRTELSDSPAQIITTFCFCLMKIPGGLVPWKLIQRVCTAHVEDGPHCTQAS